MRESTPSRLRRPVFLKDVLTCLDRLLSFNSVPVWVGPYGR